MRNTILKAYIPLRGTVGQNMVLKVESGDGPEGSEEPWRELLRRYASYGQNVGGNRNIADTSVSAQKEKSVALETGRDVALFHSGWTVFYSVWKTELGSDDLG